MALPDTRFNFAGGKKEVAEIVSGIGQAIFSQVRGSLEAASKTVVPSIQTMVSEITEDLSAGPIDRFKEMIKGESYKMLINHTNHEIKEIYLNDELAIFEVTVMDNDKKYFKFKWQVEKYLDVGPLENCWLTTVVSQPLPLGESI